MGTLDAASLDTIFREARSFNAWTDKPVSDDTLNALYDLLKWGPTSANCSPARIVFVCSKEAKEKLLPALLPQNQTKTREAPVCAIIGYDLEFYERIPELFPHNPGARNWFAGNDPLIQETAFRNSSLQGAYFMIAARALGLDCGPMSGFAPDQVNEAFFPDGKVKANFICNIGYGDATRELFDRSPRLAFQDACQIV
ncbi:MAG: malonic semialdehyde reductase [Rhodobiaceae bacterium]|nr:MAG: malonic semialdehyde reductase [Rhodobiaceae bacterium]